MTLPSIDTLDMVFTGYPESKRLMNKIKVLCLSIWYPLSMSRYFEKAFRHHPDVDLKTVGPYTGAWIPWNYGMYLPEKYALPPDIPLSLPPNVGQVSYDLVRAQLGDWKPDIVVSIDAGINWNHKPHEGFVATIGTDPHVLEYSHQRRISDKFFSMQLSYSEHGDVYLPYAYSKYDCYPVHIEGLEDGTWKDLDAVLVGNTYEQRLQWVEELKRHGVKVEHQLGVVFDEARILYNRAKIGLNWSTLNDLNCRAFELPAMKLYPVMNRVSDMHRFDAFKYAGLFSNLSEAVEQVLWAKDNPEDAKRDAELAYELILPETYDARVQQFLEECGYA
jgi:hypothetical protein